MQKIDTSGTISSQSVVNGVTEYEVHRNDGFVLIRIFKSLTEESSQQLTDLTDGMFAEHPVHFVIDCSNLTDLPLLWPRLLVKLGQKVSSDSRQIVATNVGDKLKKSLKANGLDKALQPTSMMNEALKTLGLIKRSEVRLDVSIVNPFLQATIRAIEEQTKLVPTSGKLFTRPPHSELPGEITGAISLNCANFQGYVIISFPEKMALTTTKLILGEEFQEINDVVKSAVAEITNIVFISGKRKLNEMGFAVASALPKVFLSKRLPVEIASMSQHIISVPFDTKEGSIYVEIRIA